MRVCLVVFRDSEDGREAVRGSSQQAHGSRRLRIAESCIEEWLTDDVCLLYARSRWLCCAGRHWRSVGCVVVLAGQLHRRRRNNQARPHSSNDRSCLALFARQPALNSRPCVSGPRLLWHGPRYRGLAPETPLITSQATPQVSQQSRPEQCYCVPKLCNGQIVICIGLRKLSSNHPSFLTIF